MVQYIDDGMIEWFHTHADKKAALAKAKAKFYTL